MTDIIKVRVGQIKALKMLILKEQNFCCAVCGLNMRKDTSNACLDHDHKTGYIRGVLCRNCNRGEGKILTQMTTCKRGGTGIDWLLNLMQYVLFHRIPQTNWIHPTHKTEDEKRLLRNKKARYKRKVLKDER